MSLEVAQDALDQATPETLAALAAECLSRLQPGRQPEELFEQIARLTVLSTVEIFALNTTFNASDPAVMFTRRSDSDKWWGGQMHIPGAVLLPDDAVANTHDFSAPAKRVFNNELGGIVQTDGLLHFFDLQRRSGPRGTELSPFFWTVVEVSSYADLPEDVRFFSASELREPADLAFVEGHVESALAAINAYKDPMGSMTGLLRSINF